MLELHVVKITKELGLQTRQVAATAVLLEEGGTVPFIARYRKEKTGELDEVQITAIRDRLEQLDELDKRREAILQSLAERNLLTLELEAKVDAAETITTLEDIYLPFRPKKRTRAMIAKERGLEPLAELLWAQDAATQPETAALAFRRCRQGGARRRGRARRRARHPRRAGERRRRGAREDARSVSDERRAEIEGRLRQGRGRGEVQGLLRLVGAGADGAVAPHPRHAPRRDGRVSLHAPHAAGGGSDPPARAAVREEPLARRAASQNRAARIATSGCSASRWRARRARISRSGRTRRRSASSPRTCASCCWPRRSGRRPCSRSIPAFAPAAKSCCSTGRESCSRTTSSIPRKARATRPRRRSSCWPW